MSEGNEQQILSFIIYTIILVGRGPDRGGDLGGVLHHPRVRGPRRVRPHPQDHPGPQEAGVKRQEAGEGGVHERVGKGRQEGNTLLLPACLQTSLSSVLSKDLFTKSPIIRWMAW